MSAAAEAAVSDTPKPAANGHGDDPNPGARCPRCWCRRFRVLYVRHVGRATVRKRRCNNCGNQFRTRDVVEGDKA